MRIDFLYNKYAVVIYLFVLWMIFFDDNNFIAQFKLNKELNDMKENISEYKRDIASTDNSKNRIFSSADYIEEYARENYWMKMNSEDMFVIIENSPPK